MLLSNNVSRINYLARTPQFFIPSIMVAFGLFGIIISMRGTFAWDMVFGSLSKSWQKKVSNMIEKVSLMIFLIGLFWALANVFIFKLL